MSQKVAPIEIDVKQQQQQQQQQPVNKQPYIHLCLYPYWKLVSLAEKKLKGLPHDALRQPAQRTIIGITADNVLALEEDSC